MGATIGRQGVGRRARLPRPGRKPLLPNPSDPRQRDLAEIVVSREQLRHRLPGLALEIMEDCHQAGITSLVVLGVLSGAIPFMTDLTRLLGTLDVEVDYLRASSYGKGTESNGRPAIECHLHTPLVGRHVLVVDDIYDTGTTMETLILHLLEDHNPATITNCVLLDKGKGQSSLAQPNYVGFVCPDQFVVGYGLDFAGRYRTLPCVGVLKPEVYATSTEEAE